MRRPPDLACYGIEPDDDPPLATYPATVTPGERYMVGDGVNRYEVLDWYHECCDCVGMVRDEQGVPHPLPSCQQCHGTGDGHLAPEVIASDLSREDALLLVAGGKVLGALKALVNFQKGREDWPEVKAAEAAIKLAEGES